MKYYVSILFLIVAGHLLAQGPNLETVVQTGHYEKISSVKYSIDGKYIYSASEDLTIKLWELSTGREIRTFMGPERVVDYLDISPDGKFLISVSQDGAAWIWESETGKEVIQLKDTADFITNAIYSPDGKTIITSGKKYSAMIWDAETHSLISRLQGIGLSCFNSYCSADLSISKDGRYLAVGLQNYTSEVWDLKSNKLVQTIKSKNGSCSSCVSRASISPDKKHLLTAYSSDSLKVWQVSDSTRTKFKTSVEEAETIEFSPDGQLIAAIDGGILYIINYPIGEVIWQFGDYSTNNISAFDFSPDGKSIAAGGSNKVVYILDIRNGKPLSDLSGYASVQEDSLKGTVRFWAKNLLKQDLHPDGDQIAEPKGNYVMVWDFHSGRVIKKLGEGNAGMVAAKYSPDGKILATAGGDRDISLWNTETWELLKTLKGHSATVLSLNFSHDGKYLVSGGWDYMTFVWDIESGMIYGRYKIHENGSPVSVSFMPGDLYLITGGLDQKLKMTDVDTGEEVRDLIGHRTHVVALDYSPDGTELLTGSWDGNAKLWNLSTGLQKIRFSGHNGPVYDVCFSHNGKWTATGSWDKTAKVWDAKTGKIVHDLKGSTGAIVSVNFTPDDKFLITKSREGTTRIWSLKNGNEVFSQVITEESEWLAKTPSGHFYATDQAKRSVFFVRGMESYNIERFFDQFFDPLVVENALKESPQLNKINLIEKLETSPPPSIEVISPENNLITVDKKIRILFRTTNMGGGINEIRVSNNGKGVLNQEVTEEKVQRKGKSMFSTIDVELVPGLNYLEISAFSNERIESKKQNINITLDAPDVKPDCYVLSIGINEYSNPSLNLNYAKKDASSFSTVFRIKGKTLFEKVEIISLSDKKATRENISEEIRNIAELANPQDVFFMFYAGHGSMVEETFYFIPTEVVRLYDAERLMEFAISDSQMQNMLKEIKALKQMIVLDACHSGASTEVLALRGSSEEKALAQLSRTTGVHVLAAAGSEQTAAEFETLGHGLFTYILLEALSGRADGAPNDGKVTVFELRSYIDNLVPEYSLKHKGKPQYPNTFSRGNDFPLVVY